jgi:hypothetical protein
MKERDIRAKFDAIRKGQFGPKEMIDSDLRQVDRGRSGRCVNEKAARPAVLAVALCAACNTTNVYNDIISPAVDGGTDAMGGSGYEAGVSEASVGDAATEAGGKGADAAPPLDGGGDQESPAAEAGASADAADAFGPDVAETSLPEGGGSSDGAEGGPSNCAPRAAQFIYVISDANNLYTFDPTKFPSNSAFSLIGPVTCDNSGVNSIAVDRNATAYVNFNSGAIYKVSTTTPPTCTPTGFMSGQHGFTPVLGIAFSANSPGSQDETLFVSDNAGPNGVCTQSMPGPGCMGQGLATLDPNTWTLHPVGPYTMGDSGYNAELTGTGDAKLYGFFTTAPGGLGPIDKGSGATTSTMALPTINVGTGGYAFSFWGGDFYFFTASSTPNTVVTHLQTSTGMTTVSDQLSYVIVAAGASTCSPVAPPQ